MKKIIRGLIVIAGLLSACRNVDINSKELDGTAILQCLKDSTTLLDNITNLHISDEIKKDSLNLRLLSVTKDEFMNALVRNSKHVKYFTRNYKINEGVDNETIKRINSMLCVGNEPNNIFLFDLKKNKYHNARNFFFDSKIGNYYIIKRFQFEDAETIILNSVTNEVELYIPTINVTTCIKDSLLFISDSRMITSQDEFSISIVKLSRCGIDTLFQSYTNWYSSFSFFDSDCSSIYYIHNTYLNNKIESGYAKMKLNNNMEKKSD